MKNRPAIYLGIAIAMVSSTAYAADKVIGVSIPNLTNPYYVAMKKSFEEAAPKLNYEVKVVVADDDDAKQLSQVQSLIEQRVDAIIINCVSSVPCVSTVKQANSANIPISAINILPDTRGMSEQGASIVQGVETDQFKGSTFIAGQLLKDIGPEGKALVGIVAQPGVLATDQRDDGFRKGTSANPNVTYGPLVDGRAEETTALKVVTEMLQGNPNVNVVFSDTEPAAIGAALAIKQMGAMDRVKLYAFVDKTGVQLIESGEIAAGAIQEPAKLAVLSLEGLKKFFAKEPFEAHIKSPPLLVNKNNAAQVAARAY